MLRFFLMIFIPVFCLAGDFPREALLSTLLEDLVETDAAGMRYLIDNFPYGEVNLFALQESDLDELFFLTPKSREIIWENRLKISELSDIEALDILPGEKQLLFLCQRESGQRLSARYYLRFSELEESAEGESDHRWKGPRFGQWQKLILQKGPWRGAVSIQKDPGEKKWADGINGYLEYRDNKFHLGAGSFFPDFGLGLIFSPPRFNSYKQMLNTPVQSRAKGYYGSDENWAINGFFTQAKLGKLNLFAGFGRQLFDGNKKRDYWSLSIDGLHRDSIEIQKTNKIKVDHFYIAGNYDFTFFSCGSLFSFNQFYLPVQYQNLYWRNSHFQHSIFLNFPPFGIRVELKTYPDPAINIYKSIKRGNTRMDLYAYYYGDQASLNGRHFLYNRIAAQSRGFNLRWKKQRLFKSALLLSGFINFENRYIEEKKYFTYGMDVNWGLFWKQSLGLFVSQMNELNHFTDNTYITYRLWKKFRHTGQFSAKLHLGVNQRADRNISKYFLFRYSRQVTDHFKLVIDFATWHTDEGAQVWFYQDGLPQSFSIFSGSSTGTLWTVVMEYSLDPLRLYYGISKQNHWGKTGLGSGQSSINGPYRSVHQLGVLFTI